jgi:hypothetical protein
MQAQWFSLIFGLSLLAATSAPAQVVRGVLTVTGAEMN